MRIAKDDLLCAVAGTVAFWGPSITLNALRGYDFSRLDERTLTYLEPLTTVVMFVVICILRRGSTTVKRCAVCMLLGIWILGPTCMSIGATFAGGGFALNRAWVDVLVVTVFFPVTTPWLSLYDGSFLGLLVSSSLLGVACIDLAAILSKLQLLSRNR